MHGSFNNQDQTVSQARALPSFEKSYDNETAAQRLKHREIAWRDQQRKRRRSPRPKIFIRIRELERIFADRYGAALPNDDAGLDDIFVTANHLAHLNKPEQRITAWLQRWAPWFGDDRTTELIEMVVPRPEKWCADDLAQRIGLDYATRTRLKITMIGATDCGKAARKTRRRKNDAARHRALRAKADAKPHASSAAKTKPWKALKISRATYYRNLKNETAETNSSAAYAKHIWWWMQQSHGDASARLARSARPEFRVSPPCDTQRIVISIPAEFREMMLAARRGIIAAAIPKISIFPRAVVAARDGSRMIGARGARA